MGNLSARCDGSGVPEPFDAEAIEPLGSQQAAANGEPSRLDIVANRDTYGRVIFYFGDSVSRGATLHKFPDQFTQEEAEGEPNWSFRSPASTTNTALDRKNVVAVFAGNTGRPDRVNKRFEEFVTDGVIRIGDVVVLQYAGHHNKNPDQYEAN
jgi:hypothetical protein